MGYNKNYKTNNTKSYHMYIEPYEVSPNPVCCESGIYSSLFSFFCYGLEPGSYTSAMIAHRFNRAKQSAHPMLLQPITDDLETAHDLITKTILDLPVFFTGKNAKSWPGYLSLGEEQTNHILKSYSDDRIEHWKTYRILCGERTDSFKIWIDRAESLRRRY